MNGTRLVHIPGPWRGPPDELTRRVTLNAEAAAAAHNEEVASELFAIERALGGASRRLSRLSASQDRKARR
jgi:hypothetical protein